MRVLIITMAIIMLALFSQAQQKGTFKDKRDGKTYKTVTISTQTWMAENVNFDVAGSWCNNCETYGRLYTFDAAKTVCPSGWHLPSSDEWKTLMRSMDGDAGQELKSVEGWEGDGINYDTYGFTALPAGSSWGTGKFEWQGSYTYWWTANEKDADKGWCYYTGNDISYLDNSADNKTNGYSVRCLKD